MGLGSQIMRSRWHPELRWRLFAPRKALRINSKQRLVIQFATRENVKVAISGNDKVSQTGPQYFRPLPKGVEVMSPLGKTYRRHSL